MFATIHNTRLPQVHVSDLRQHCIGSSFLPHHWQGRWMYTFPLPKAQDHTVGLCDSDCPLVVVTSQMYDRYQCFAGWAGEQEIDPPDPFVAQIVSFLHSLFWTSFGLVLQTVKMLHALAQVLHESLRQASSKVVFLLIIISTGRYYELQALVFDLKYWLIKPIVL